MIKNILDTLPDQKRRQLMYAFEHEFAQYVEFTDGRFIGVNVGPIKHLTVLETAGVWATGTIGGKYNESNV